MPNEQWGLVPESAANFIVHNPAMPPTASATADSFNTVTLSQWTVGPNDTFIPSGPSYPTIPEGVYTPNIDAQGNVFFARETLQTDTLIEMEDPESISVLTSIRTFWANEPAYISRGVLHKRGIILCGPAGSGKTALITLLMQELVRNGGTVVLCKHPGIASRGIRAFRRIEPKRPLIVVYEDIEEIIRAYGEHELLALLDGEHQVGNIVNIASTNYPETLGARIINRPSRFDERVLIDMPGPRSREKYIRAITVQDAPTDSQIKRWVKDSDGFSLAHIRELLIAVHCLGQPYESVLERLKSLQHAPKAIPEFVSGIRGFLKG